MTDDLGRKPMSRVRSGLMGHAVSFACLHLKRERQLTWQCLRTGFRRCSLGCGGLIAACHAADALVRQFAVGRPAEQGVVYQGSKDAFCQA